MKIRKILLVDNNATIVELISTILVKEGYEVAKAYNGIDALDQLEAMKELPDVILLDLVMPKIDGQRLTRILKVDERYAGIPIIILTGIAAEEDGKLLAFGADAYIAKGKIENTFTHIKETLQWLEKRATADVKREEVLGVDNLFPREMTKELLLVKQHFDTMFHLMQEGVIEIDEDHRILFANPAAQRLLCQGDHHLFGKTVQDLFNDSQKFKEYLDRLPDRGRKSFESVQLACGELVSRAIATPFFLDSEYIGAIIMLQDVTTLVEREKSLEGLMSAVVENAPVGLCLLDGEGDVLVANQALVKIFHRTPGWKPLGLNIVDFLAGVSPPLAEALRRSLSLEPGRLVTHKADYFPEGEHLRQVLNVTAKTLDLSGEEQVLLLVEDVTEKALLEENLRRINEEMERANRSKSTFLSMVSHELRTPLSVVRGYVSLILEGRIGPGMDQIREALQVADKRARHLQHLIEELLDLSRIEAGKLSIKKENLDLRKHLEETAEMFRDDQEQKKLAMELDIPDDLPAVYADHDKIHQVFTNLISNAVKFSNPGGAVTISARASGESVEIQVLDSGIGIPADRLDRIFDKFYQVDSSDTRKHPGTGLGLSIVKMIIEALGGGIHVTSEVGEGTAFTITLPAGTEVRAAKKSLPAKESKPAKEARISKRTRVLAVEDDTDILELIRLFLPEEKYEVVVATDAFKGLRQFFRQRPDIVLADALMPLMSGLDLCRIIKTHPETEGLPVIILSAAAQENEIRDGYKVGADEYLVKPFTSQDLLDTIGKYVS
jgi:PAS domain S-box-containing protein